MRYLIETKSFHIENSILNMRKISWMMYISLSLIVLVMTPSHGNGFNQEDRDLLNQILVTLTSQQFPIRRDVGSDQTFEKTEKFNRVIDKTMQLINVLAQLDNFVSRKAKRIVHNLNILYNAEDGY